MHTIDRIGNVIHVSRETSPRAQPGSPPSSSNTETRLTGSSRILRSFALWLPPSIVISFALKLMRSGAILTRWGLELLAWKLRIEVRGDIGGGQ